MAMSLILPISKVNLIKPTAPIGTNFLMSWVTKSAVTANFSKLPRKLSKKLLILKMPYLTSTPKMLKNFAAKLTE